jgi:hypothetical protein
LEASGGESVEKFLAWCTGNPCFDRSNMAEKHVRPEKRINYIIFDQILTLVEAYVRALQPTGLVRGILRDFFSKTWKTGHSYGLIKTN